MNQVEVKIRPRTVWIVGLNVALVAIAYHSFQRLSPLLVLGACALLLALALEPAVSALSRLGLGRTPAVFVMASLVIGALTLFGYALLPLILNQVRSLVRAAPGLLQRLQESPSAEELARRLGLEPARLQNLALDTGHVVSSVADVVFSTVSAGADVIAVVMLAIFGLLFGRQLHDSALSLLPPSKRARMQRVLARIALAVTRYAGGLLLVCLAAGVFTALTTFFLGVPYFLALGCAVALLGMVPYLGSFVGAILVSLTALASVGLERALIGLVLFLIYQQIEGNLLQPLIQRRALGMNPLLIMITVLGGGALWGLFGAVMALPVAAALQVTLQELVFRPSEAIEAAEPHDSART